MLCTIFVFPRISSSHSLIILGAFPPTSFCISTYPYCSCYWIHFPPPLFNSSFPLTPSGFLLPTLCFAHASYQLLPTFDLLFASIRYMLPLCYAFRFLLVLPSSFWLLAMTAFYFLYLLFTISIYFLLATSCVPPASYLLWSTSHVLITITTACCEGSDLSESKPSVQWIPAACKWRQIIGGAPNLTFCPRNSLFAGCQESRGSMSWAGDMNHLVIITNNKLSNILCFSIVRSIFSAQLFVLWSTLFTLFWRSIYLTLSLFRLEGCSWPPWHCKQFFYGWVTRREVNPKSTAERQLIQMFRAFLAKFTCSSS